MNKTILATGAISALIAVLLGAFGAHGLEKLVASENVTSFTTGVRYQMYHAIALLVLGNMNLVSIPSKKKVFYFFLIGMILFSGSIYLLVVDEIIGISMSSIGFITPIGGLLLIAGWSVFAITIIRSK